jgi:hypothetical protein
MADLQKPADARNPNSYPIDDPSDQWIELQEWRHRGARLIAVKFGLPITTAATIADLVGMGEPP